MYADYDASFLPQFFGIPIRKGRFFFEKSKSRKTYLVATQMKALDALKPNLATKTVSGMFFFSRYDKLKVFFCRLCVKVAWSARDRYRPFGAEAHMAFCDLCQYAFIYVKIK